MDRNKVNTFIHAVNFLESDDYFKPQPSIVYLQREATYNDKTGEFLFENDVNELKNIYIFGGDYDDIEYVDVCINDLVINRISNHVLFCHTYLNGNKRCCLELPIFYPHKHKVSIYIQSSDSSVFKIYGLAGYVKSKFRLHFPIHPEKKSSVSTQRFTQFRTKIYKEWVEDIALSYARRFMITTEPPHKIKHLVISGYFSNRIVLKYTGDEMLVVDKVLNGKEPSDRIYTITFSPEEMMLTGHFDFVFSFYEEIDDVTIFITYERDNWLCVDGGETYARYTTG